jgi:hypothetical protein
VEFGFWGSEVLEYVKVSGLTFWGF